MTITFCMDGSTPNRRDQAVFDYAHQYHNFHLITAAKILRTTHNIFIPIFYLS